MRLETDVLVIGLGPAGGAAALAAALGDVRVLAVERKSEIGIPVQCAEWIPLALGRYAQRSGVLAQVISGMESILPSGSVMKTQTPGLMVNRSAFDQVLARSAAEAGARLQLNSTLRQLDAARRCALIDTPQGRLECGYKVLIAADGPYSKAATLLGLPRQPVVHARQYTVPLTLPGDETRIWLSSDYPGGYAWLFPKGKVANLGVGVDKSMAPNLKIPLDRLHQRLVREGMVEENILAYSGGVIPVGGLRPQLLIENVMLVGDAGGFTHPITGAGIAAAVSSGEWAGQAAADWLKGRKNALREFEIDMSDQYQASLQRAVQRRALFASGVYDDAALRKGWVAFPEYFLEGAG